jgi:uncharacterized protein YjbJ (UPF0337 family)
MVSLKQHRQRFQRLGARIVCLLILTVAVWGGTWVPASASDSVGTGSEKAAAIMRERAANELDRMAGSGSSDMVEGTVENAAGKAQRGVGRVKGAINDALDNGRVDGKADQVEGAANQVKGKTRREIGRAKGKASDLGSDIEDAAENAVDSVKAFFD